MKKIYSVLLILFLVFIGKVTSQTTYTWTGTQDNLFSTIGNWTISSGAPTFLPGSLDDIVFDATSNGNFVDCNFDQDVVVASCSLLSGYTGTLDMQGGNHGFNNLVVNSGTVIGSSGSVNMLDASGTFSLGTSGTYNTNGGALTLTMSPGVQFTFAGNIVLNSFNLTAGGNGSERNVNFGTNLVVDDFNLSSTAGSKPIGFTGAIHIKNSMNISAGNSNAVPATNTGTFIIDGTSVSITGASAAAEFPLPNVQINTAGTYDIADHLNVRGNWIATQGTLTANNSTVNFYSTSASITGTAAAFDNINIQSGASVTMPTLETKVGGNVVKTGTLTFQSTSALGLNGTGNQSIDLTGTSLAAINAYSSSTRNVNITGAVNVLDSILAETSVTLNTGGSLTLKSTSALKGRVGRVGGTISGNVTVETFIPGGTTGWANLGVSGVTGETVADWDTYVSSAGATGIPMTCTGCVYSQSIITSWFNSIAAWDEPSQDYDTLIVASSSLVTGKGYWVYVGDGFSTTNDMKLVNTGPVVQGGVTIPLTSTSGTNGAQGMNLVANPYASPISWTKVLAASGGTATGLTNAIYVWNADIGGGTTTSFANGVSSHGAGITDVIPAGQGFYVETTAGTNLVFNESVKTNSNTGTHPLLKPASSTKGIGDVFWLKLKGVYDWDETAFRVHPDASPAFDKNWDARKIFQSPGYAGYPGPYTKYTTISSKDVFEEDYSIHSIPSLMEKAHIPVLVKVSTTGTYTIEATGTENINDCISLKDNLTNTITDLKTSSYVFTINDSTSAPRFELILCKESQNTVGIKKQEQSNSIVINQDEFGAYVKTDFAQSTKATISVYNIIGQKLMEDVKVEGTVTNTHLNVNTHNQVVLIRVITDKESQTKKIVLH